MPRSRSRPREGDEHVLWGSHAAPPTSLREITREEMQLAAKSKLDRYLDRASSDIPAMPEIAQEVIRLSDDPDSSIEDLRALIDQDAAIAARILKVSNSALYGFPSEILGLGHAIALLGTVTTRNLVLAASMKQTFKNFGLMEKLLW